MPIFTYTAKSDPVKVIEGQIEAQSEQEAVNKLTTMGYFPIAVSALDLSSGKKGLLNQRKVSGKELLMFTSQLSTLVGSGVNILNSFNIISGQAENKYFKAVLADVTAKIKDGKPTSESLGMYPHIFPAFYTSMVRSGEASGKLDEALLRLASFMEKEEEFKNSISSALTYPAFIMAVSCLTVAVLLGFVIPKLVGMFEDLGQALPLPTKILINISAALRTYWWLIGAVIFYAVFFLARSYKNSRGRVALDEFALKAPLWGDIVLKSEVSRMMRTLSLLISGGMTIGPCLDIAASVLNNQVLKNEAQKFREEVNKGVTLSQVFKSSKFFPEFTVNIITIGEETGSLEKSFLRIADEYEKETDRKLKALTRLLEPVIILVMGVVVGFIVLSMLLPIFQINIVAR